MIHFKNLILSMLAGWATAWAVLLGWVATESISRAMHRGSWSEVASAALIYGAYTLIVVAAAWLLVATPYYFFCIRKGWIQSTLAHLGLASLLAAGFTGAMAQGETGAWLGLGIPAVLSALVGTLVLLRRNPQYSISNIQSSIP